MPNNDYLQNTENLFIDEMVQAGIVAPDGRILDSDKYLQWLNKKQETLRTELQNVPEPGDVYDRYRANLLYKDIDIIQNLIRRQTNPGLSAAQEKANNRERELINRTSVFTRALDILNARKNSLFSRISNGRK